MCVYIHAHISKECFKVYNHSSVIQNVLLTAQRGKKKKGNWSLVLPFSLDQLSRQPIRSRGIQKLLSHKIYLPDVLIYLLKAYCYFTLLAHRESVCACVYFCLLHSTQRNHSPHKECRESKISSEGRQRCTGKQQNLLDLDIKSVSIRLFVFFFK